MASLTTYGANAILDGTPLPDPLYMQAHTGAPTDAGTANVATETSRVAVARTAAAAGVATNDLEAGWENWPADETITHITFWDASSGGNCWMIGDEADGGEAILTGQNLTVAPGDLTFTLAIYTP